MPSRQTRRVRTAWPLLAVDGPPSCGGHDMVRRVETDSTTGRSYADASGDDNPIHLDDRAARALGLPGAIAHGFWTMTQLARVAVDAAGGGDPFRLRRLDVEF